MTSTDAAIAAFLANGGKVSKVAQGATCGMTARDFRNAARDPKPVEVVQETVYIPEQGMVALLSNFLRNKGMFRIERNLVHDFGKIDAEFRRDDEPSIANYQGKARTAIRIALLSIVEGFTWQELAFLDISNEEYETLNRLYRSVGRGNGGGINLL